MCSLAIGLYLCLPGSDHPGCAEDLLKNVKHCHPHHILDGRQREESERERLEGKENKVSNNDTRTEHFKEGSTQAENKYWTALARLDREI